MKKVSAAICLAFTLNLVACTKPSEPAEKYWVTRTTTSKHCKVQLATAAPVGERFLGPFDTKDQATTAMCNAYDPSGTSDDKCWTVYPANACPTPTPTPTPSRSP